MELEPIILTVLSGSITLIVGLILYIWNTGQKRIEDGDKASERSINEKITNVTKLVSDTNQRVDNALGQIDKIRDSYVSKEDHRIYAEQLNKALEGLSYVIREMQKTMTERIDLILFEVGRKHNDK